MSEITLHWEQENQNIYHADLRSLYLIKPELIVEDKNMEMSQLVYSDVPATDWTKWIQHENRDKYQYLIEDLW